MVWQLRSCCRYVCTKMKVLDGSRAGRSMYRPLAPSCLSQSLACWGFVFLCNGEEYKLLNERKRHRVPRLSASVESTMYKAKGIGELESTEQRENAGDFPGVDHAPGDSRLPHSVTRGAGRITILRAKATTACQSFSFSHICYLSHSLAATRDVVAGCST